jgi:hypothetical protein
MPRPRNGHTLSLRFRFSGYSLNECYHKKTKDSIASDNTALFKISVNTALLKISDNTALLKISHNHVFAPMRLQLDLETMLIAVVSQYFCCFAISTRINPRQLISWPLCKLNV